MAYGMVSFIGAGPGDPELITLKGRRLIEEADLVVYAGSLVPKELVACAKSGAVVLDSASMTLAETHAAIREAALAGKNVARVHTGDPSLYGAVPEQAALLDAEGISWQVVPGVTAAFAAAAAAKVSFTMPERVQSFAIARVEGKTPVPEGQSVRAYAAHGGSIAVYLSAGDALALERELIEGGAAPDTKVVAAYRVGWPDQKIVVTQVDAIAETAQREGLDRQTVFLVLPGAAGAGEVSRLYAEEFTHMYRKGSRHD